jgi:hypothetical protein
MAGSGWKRRCRITIRNCAGHHPRSRGTALAVGITHPGRGDDGTGVTPIGFTVTPAGQQTNLGDLPLNAASSPDGRWLVVSNDGQGTQSVQVIDTTTRRNQRHRPRSDGRDRLGHLQ